MVVRLKISDIRSGDMPCAKNGLNFQYSHLLIEGAEIRVEIFTFHAPLRRDGPF